MDHPSVPRWRHVALAVAMFLITGSVGFLQPFVPLYIKAAGLNKTEFGLVSSLGTATALLIQPILGRFSDRFDARRPFMVAAALCAGVAYLSYRSAVGALAFVLLTALGVNGSQYLNVVGGVLVGRMAKAAGGGAAYVRYRVWGSVGYICIGMAAGLLVNHHLANPKEPTRMDLDPIFTYGPLLFFVLAGVALLVPDARNAALTPPPAVRVGREVRAGTAGLTNLDFFLFAYFLYQFGLYGASPFLALYMQQLGGSPLIITAMFAAGVICEVLVMTRIGRWTDTYGRRPALAASFILMPIRLLLYIPATSPLWVLCVQSLHGINFGIVGTMAVVFVNDLAGDANRGALQARLAVTSGLALAIAPLLCGWLSDQIGIRGMFAAMSLVGAMAAALFVVKVRDSHPSPATPPGLLRYLA